MTGVIDCRNVDGKRFIDDLQSIGRLSFSASEFEEKCGLSPLAARGRLRRLRSLVERVSRGYLLIVPPEFRAQGAPPVEAWLDDYFRWLGHPYYVALQSAAGIHGSNPQAIQTVQVMTDSPRREIAVGRLRIRFFLKRQAVRTPVQEVPASYAPLRVSTPSATIFDLVRYAPRIGGIGRAAETLGPLLPGIPVHELRLSLDLEEDVPTAQRLGYVVEKLGQEKLAGTIRAWLPEALPWIPLSGGRRVVRADAARFPRWHVWDAARQP